MSPRGPVRTPLSDTLPSLPSEDTACRLDVWLWRARFLKTRSLAAVFVEQGRVRVTRDGLERRQDRRGRTVRPGDQLVFAIGGRLHAVRLLACGDRRGPPAEARGLYEDIGGGPPPA